MFREQINPVIQDIVAYLNLYIVDSQASWQSFPRLRSLPGNSIRFHLDNCGSNLNSLIILRSTHGEELPLKTAISEFANLIHYSFNNPEISTDDLVDLEMDIPNIRQTNFARSAAIIGRNLRFSLFDLN